MQITHVVDHEKKTVRATAVGMVTLAGIIQHLNEERRDAGLGYHELIDARDVTVNLAPEDVRKIVDVLTALAGEQPLGPTAVIVSTDHAYGMMRMLGMLVDEICSIRAFRSAEDAEAWLQGMSGPAGA